ncbi:hypothetical protein BGZ49_004465, partial [Haplosporangium sp. Z 27]
LESSKMETGTINNNLQHPIFSISPRSCLRSGNILIKKTGLTVFWSAKFGSSFSKFLHSSLKFTGINFVIRLWRDFIVFQRTLDHWELLEKTSTIYNIESVTPPYLRSLSIKLDDIIAISPGLPTMIQNYKNISTLKVSVSTTTDSSVFQKTVSDLAYLEGLVITYIMLYSRSEDGTGQ